MFIKRNPCMPPNKSVPDVQQKRKKWEQLLSWKIGNRLVFLDESGVNTPSNTTILSSVRMNGETAYTIYKGGTTAERFAEYLKSILLPTLSKTDIIVMDNMRSHHAKTLKEVLEQSGIQYCYLPPYSPDLNPIEKMWSKIKASLRKQKVRIAAELPKAVKLAFSTIRQSDCMGWFHSCNYVQ